MSSNEKMRATIRSVRDKLKITKVICTRSVKGRGGDHFVGFSATWDSVQDDGGKGMADLLSDAEQAESGMTLKEAKIAAHLLGMQADITAFENATAGSIVSQEESDAAIRALKNNYGLLMEKLLGSKE